MNLNKRGYIMLSNASEKLRSFCQILLGLDIVACIILLFVFTDMYGSFLVGLAACLLSLLACWFSILFAVILCDISDDLKAIRDGIKSIKVESAKVEPASSVSTPNKSASSYSQSSKKDDLLRSIEIAKREKNEL